MLPSLLLVLQQHIPKNMGCMPCNAGVYTYNFVANVAGPYWWRSTWWNQTASGLWGPLIISDPAEPNYAADSVVAVSEW